MSPMHRLSSTCAGLALAFGLAGCAQQTNWACYLNQTPSSAAVIDLKTGRVLYIADTLQREKHRYTGVTTYIGNNLRAADDQAFNQNNTVTISGTSITLVTYPDSKKIEECIITLPRGQHFRAKQSDIRPLAFL